ncbi:MAG: hypothetical protein DRH93_20545 [Deltaproteobacteria bacterium]|nr:MAG: hypothetical protein DRH93_20545 [Deltaproteobacteria bacterium]
MASGSITSVGIGSGLDLQNILDQLKEADRGVINAKVAKKTGYQKEINSYNGVNAKLFAMKSNALDLSLQSNYMQSSSSVTDDNILDAVVVVGVEESSYTIDFTQKAQRNSWESTGTASVNDIMFAEPVTGIAGPDEVVTTISETMSIYYGESGSEQQIDISLASGLSLTEIVEQINSSSNNQDGDGVQLVNATLGLNSDEEYYIRLSAVSGGNSADSEISVAGFTYVQADTMISITQDDTSMYLSVRPGASFQEVTDLINTAADNPGVTAAMIDNGDASDPYQFTLSADNTGENARITLSNLVLTEVTGAAAASLDAMLTVNGIAYRRQSNEAISDIITGVTLNLRNIGETTVNIETDMSSIKENIISLVEGFNNLVSYIKGSNDTTEEETSDDEKEDETVNPLAESNDVNRLISKLKSLMTTIVDIDSGYTSLADLGMVVNKDGTISLDEDDLDQAIASNPDAVTSLFLGDAEKDITGMGDLINDSIKNMVSSQGVIATEIDTLKAMSARLDKDIETSTERLDKRYETMTAEFIRLDSYIRQLNSEASYMQTMFDSFNNSKE